MENRGINASLSTRSRTFRPGGPPVSFEVTVINDSDQFAAFQLEVLAAGDSRSSGSLWYRLSPEVSTAKPPGSSTVFEIVIFDTPLPAFVGTINLTIRIFSPQLREERKLLARLTIEQGTKRTLLSVDLPVKRFQAYPLNPVDIPVWVRNWGQEPVEVVLRLAGVERSALIRSPERRLWVDPGVQAETTLQCQPPSALQAPSKEYTFIVEASSRDDGAQAPSRTQGVLEVLPVGFIEFTATPQQQTIPSQGGWLPDWKSNSASFQLLFKNKSNMLQQVNVELQGRDQQNVTYRVLPEYADLGLGEATEVLLETKTKRPWVGWAKTLQLEAKSVLSDQRLGNTDPGTQTLELRVLPVVPLWLLLALLALVAALLALLLRKDPIGHTDFVNAVRFSNDATSVVSGSDDCTIRRWKINPGGLEPDQNLEPDKNLAHPVTCNGKPLQPTGVLAETKAPVRALRFDPRGFLAAGMENGVIQGWNVEAGDKQYELKDPSDKTADRVFELVFSPSALTLYSGHGSGKIRVWAKQPFKSFQFEPNPVTVLSLISSLNYQVRALALKTKPVQNGFETSLVSAGQYKRLILWDLLEPEPNQHNRSLKFLSSPKLLLLKEPSGRQGQNDYIWSVAFVPKTNQKLLTTSDSDGYITIWDLDQCQDNINPPSKLNEHEPIEQKCEPHDRWRAAETSVRSLAFAPHDDRQLVSAGDDGRVVIWPLTVDHKLDLQDNSVKCSKEQGICSGREIYNSPNKLNSVDVQKKGVTMIVSGGDDFKVRLHRLP